MSADSSNKLSGNLTTTGVVLLLARNPSQCKKRITP